MKKNKKEITPIYTTKNNGKMYKTPKFRPSLIKRNKSVQGETIEEKIERIVNNKEPIKDGAPIIYTERKDGVKAAYNIRTDRFEIAIDAMDKIQKSYTARREERAKGKKGETQVETKDRGDGGAEPIQGKPGDTDSNK